MHEPAERHLIFIVANHFEPAWSANGFLDLPTQQARLDHWFEMARTTGDLVKDHDGTPFRHTNFYPAEQYHPSLLKVLAAMQADGLGEVEVHLHHGIDGPDTLANLRRTLESFRDRLADEHKCLSRLPGDEMPRYAFVHGNLALANSAGGMYCGVDSEMQVLADTGCYADLTLPSAPERTQVPKINAVYQCGHALTERSPHRSGPNLKQQQTPTLPVILTGPLVFNWRRRLYGLPIPRLDDGVLAANYALDIDRLNRWANANITVQGRPEWVFIKLYCHGFFPNDQDIVIGEGARRFWNEVLDYAERTGKLKIHFATAREAFNIAMAATDGLDGNPHKYRNYKLIQIMDPQSS